MSCYLLNHDQGTNKTVQLVISRYNEDLEWLKEFPFTLFTDIIIYNKGVNNEFYHPDVVKMVRVKNVGRCDHTYLYHIIENYDKLKDITIFYLDA